ncbi:N-acetyltransferase domain-containing protein [Pleurotus pulmonarius]|nr:hypothetical protein EYR36_001520 [Pleurotus pulmonarius]
MDEKPEDDARSGNTELSTNILRSTTPGFREILPHILALSNSIFSAIPRDPGAHDEQTHQSHHGSLNEWLRRLSLPGAFIVYLTQCEPSSVSVYPPNPYPPKSEEIVAFVFVHPRTHDDVPLSSRETISGHVWIAGVRPDLRRLGCLERIMQRVEAEVREAALASDSDRRETPVTICTVPSRFPAMWTWLLARNWNVEREMKGKIMLSKHLRL